MEQENIIPPEIQTGISQIRRKMNESAARFETRDRCTITTITLMISLAVIYDLLQAGLDFIPFVGWVFSFIVGGYSWLTFYIWTSILGWNKADWAAKKALTSESAVKFFSKYIFPALGLVPIVNIIPEITGGVILSIILIKAQDTLYNKTKGKVDQEVIMEGIAFFDMIKNIYSDKWTNKPKYQPK